MLFRKRKHPQGAGTAVVERRPELAEADALANEGRHMEAIAFLSELSRQERDAELDRAIRRHRHLAGIALVAAPESEPRYPDPIEDELPVGDQSHVPEVIPGELTAPLLRGAILQSGCLLVRGLMDPELAKRVAADIDRTHEIRTRLDEGDFDPDGYYDELEPEPGYTIPERDWVEEGGGVLAADSPRLLFDMIECFDEAGLREVIADYLGERPAISAQKCTLRKATPDVPGAWHQDGRFLGEVRALNVWLSLSRCGDVAPSMDVVPRRLNDFVAAGTEGTVLDFQVSQAVAEEAAGEAGIVRPIFDPGDALLFDDRFLHQTGSDPEMPNARYAIESWFFGPSAYPANYVPLAF